VNLILLLGKKRKKKPKSALQLENLVYRGKRLSKY
jgi:hypothetical protein